MSSMPGVMRRGRVAAVRIVQWSLRHIWIVLALHTALVLAFTLAAVG